MPRAFIIERSFSLNPDVHHLFAANGFDVVSVDPTRRPISLNPRPGQDLIVVSLADLNLLPTSITADQGQILLFSEPPNQRGELMHAVSDSAQTSARTIRSLRSVADYLHEIPDGPTISLDTDDLSARSEGLTNREGEILTLLSHGLTGEEIASRLFLSSETVKTHVRNAMWKLNAKTRVQAVARAISEGYIAAVVEGSVEVSDE